MFGGKKFGMLAIACGNGVDEKFIDLVDRSFLPRVAPLSAPAGNNRPSLSSGLNGLPSMEFVYGEGNQPVKIDKPIYQDGDNTCFALAYFQKSGDPSETNPIVWGGMGFMGWADAYINVYMGGVRYATPKVLPEKRFFTISATYIKSTGQLLWYLDGVLQGVISATAGIDHSTFTSGFIGHLETNRRWNGKIQFVGSIHGALTTDEHAELNRFLRSWLPQPSAPSEFKMKVTGNGTAIDEQGVRTLTAQTAGFPLAVNRGLNGNKVFAFDGVDDRGLTVSPGLTLNQDWTMFFPMELISNTGTRVLYTQRTASPHSGLWIAITNTTIRFFLANLGTLSSLEYNYSSVIKDNNMIHILALRYTHSPARVDFFINGKIIVSGALTFSMPDITNDQTGWFGQSDSLREVHERDIQGFEHVLEALPASEIAGKSRMLRMERD